MKLYEYVIRLKDQASDKFQKLAAAAGDSARKVDNVRQKLNGAASAAKKADDAFGGLKKTVATAFAVGTIWTLATSIAQAGSDMEQTRTAYNVLIGDVEKSGALLGKLQKFADVSPFNTQEVMNAGQALLGFNVHQKQLLPVMNTLGDLSMGNANKFKGLVDNYGKMVSSQKANTVDLNQFAIAGVPIWDELGKITGKSGEELRKFAEKGVSIKLVNQALSNLTSKGGKFFGMMAAQSKTTLGKWSTLTSGLQNIGVKLFNAVQPLLNVLLDLGTLLIGNEKLLKTLGIIVGIVGGMWLIYRASVLATNAVMTAYVAGATLVRLAKVLLTGGFAKLNLVLRLNPIGLVITLITALVTALLVAYQKVDWFRGAIWGLWAAFKEFFMSIADIAKNVFGGLWDSMQGLLDRDFTKMKAGMLKFGKGMLATTPGALPWSTARISVKSSSKAIRTG